MKKILTWLIFMVPSIFLAQSPGLYNGTEGLSGSELKNKLHQIIKNHYCLSYYYSKYILLESDADPAIPGNVLLVYDGRSQNGLDYGTGGNQLQREHIWAKSHGNFNEVLPMFSDVHNLKPCDASINNSRSNLDFDNGGFTHPEATGCKYDDDSWEPRDEDKGDIARIIFYMDARYQGGEGEIDLTAKDAVNNYPNPWHGKLSTLLQWNDQDLPDAFERNRNNVIASYQGNRNPFIDYPDYARFIWGNGQSSSTLIGNIGTSPTRPRSTDQVTVTCTVEELQVTGVVKVLWGSGHDYLENELIMQKTGDQYSASLPSQPAGSSIYFAVQTSDDRATVKSVVYKYTILNEYPGSVITISEIQGTGPETPYYEQTVTTTGIVTASNNNGYFLQDYTGPRNGIYVYDSGRNPSIGDSVIVTGKAIEYYFLTEINNLTDYVLITQDVPLPAPSVITASQVGEDYESVLVRVANGVCTYATPWDNYDMWRVNDGTGTLNVHNNDIFEFDPVLNETYTITGPLNYNYEEWKIELRWLQDVMNPVGIFEYPELERLEIFPNPVCDKIMISLPEGLSSFATISIFDVLGKLKIIMEIEVTASSQLIDLKSFGIKTGIYFMILESEEYRASAMIIVKRD